DRSSGCTNAPDAGPGRSFVNSPIPPQIAFAECSANNDSVLWQSLASFDQHLRGPAVNGRHAANAPGGSQPSEGCGEDGLHDGAASRVARLQSTGAVALQAGRSGSMDRGAQSGGQGRAEEGGPVTEQFFERPILNSPYAFPGRHWELDADGQPTNRIINTRRRSDLITPVPKPKKRRRARGQAQ